MSDRLVVHPDRVVPKILARLMAPEVLPVTHDRGSAENFEFPPDEIFGALHPGKNHRRTFQIPNEGFERIRIIFIRAQGRRTPTVTRNVGEWRQGNQFCHRPSPPQ